MMILFNCLYTYIYIAIWSMDIVHNSHTHTSGCSSDVYIIKSYYVVRNVIFSSLLFNHSMLIYFFNVSPRRVPSYSDPTDPPINHGVTRDHNNSNQQQHHATQWRLHGRAVPEWWRVCAGAEQACVQVTNYFPFLSQAKSYDTQLCGE